MALRVKRIFVSICATFAIGGFIFAFSHFSRLPEIEARRIAENYLAKHYEWAHRATYSIKRGFGAWQVTIRAPDDVHLDSAVLSIEVSDEGIVSGFM